MVRPSCPGRAPGPPVHLRQSGLRRGDVRRAGERADRLKDIFSAPVLDADSPRLGSAGGGFPAGWAQIKYGYGASVEEAKEKLRFDLYYIRNVSIMLDFLIVFYTIRAVIIGRGVR